MHNHRFLSNLAEQRYEELRQHAADRHAVAAHRPGRSRPAIFLAVVVFRLRLRFGWL